MITIPSLDSTQDINETDLIMVTTSEGLSYKMAGSELNKRHKVVIASSTTLTGAPLKTGNVIRVYFTADITTDNTNTALTLSYNSVNYPVKVPKDGALTSLYAHDMGSGSYKYLQAYTTLEFVYDGTNFVLIGNPVILSGNGFTIFANATVNKGDVGLGNVANTGDSATPVSGGTTKFTTGGAYTELAKKVDVSTVGAVNGVASLDAGGKVPSNELPSYVDDVLEYTNKASFPASGETGKIYVDKATGKCWRWSGSVYVELSSYAEATTSASGLMSATDKTKLNGLTKGSAANNVPNIGTALGTTDNNIVVTNSSGALKPYGTTVPNVMTYGIFSTADATISSGVATLSLTTPTGLTVSAGSILRATFSKALESASAITEVKLTYGGVTKTVKAARGGSLKNVVSHVFTGGDYTSSKPNKVWDAYTTLELMYSGSEWIVMGNPVLCSYFSTTQSYTVYANGLIEQRGEYSSNGNTLVTTNFYIKYPNNNTVLITGYSPSRTTEAATDNLTMYSKSLESFKTGWNNHHSNEWKVNWFATGY